VCEKLQSLLFIPSVFFSPSVIMVVTTETETFSSSSCNETTPLEFKLSSVERKDTSTTSVVSTAKDNNRDDNIFRPPSIAEIVKLNSLLMDFQPNEQIDALYEKATKAFWRADEVDFSEDYIQWQKLLSVEEKTLLSYVLLFFLYGDTLVANNLASRFYGEAKPNAQPFYGFQIMIEDVHKLTYKQAFQTLVEVETRDQLVAKVQSMPCVIFKARWVEKWIDDASDYFVRIVAMACVEAIFFSGSFCVLYWFKTRNLMPGLTYSNELISRDEGFHCEFAYLQYRLEGGNVDHNIIRNIVTNAVEIEKQFVHSALPTALAGMNATLMCQYVEYVADRVLVQFGVTPYYNVTNPFPFMDLMSLDPKTAFFERDVSDYQRTSVKQKSTSNNTTSANSSFLFKPMTRF